MIQIFSRRISIMIVFAISLHFTWSALLLADPSTIHVTAIDALYRYIDNVHALAAIVAGAAALASWGLFARMPWVVLLLIPQQILLMMSASGSIEAIWVSHFADGIVRSRGFLAADQLYAIVAAICHTIAIVIHARSVSERSNARTNW